MLLRSIRISYSQLPKMPIFERNPGRARRSTALAASVYLLWECDALHDVVKMMVQRLLLSRSEFASSIVGGCAVRIEVLFEDKATPTSIRCIDVIILSVTHPGPSAGPVLVEHVMNRLLVEALHRVIFQNAIQALGL